MTYKICFGFDSAVAQRLVSCVLAHVPGMAWIATLNGGEIAAFVSAVVCIWNWSSFSLHDKLTTRQTHQPQHQVNGYLPVVLLLVIILILPHIFYGIALHYEDRKTESDVQSSIIGRYFYYQVILSHSSVLIDHVRVHSSPGAPVA
jgi:hypothetical protein